MYERNAIVLERYFCKKLGYQKTNNLRENFNNYCDLLDKIEQFQVKNEAENKALTELNLTEENVIGNVTVMLLLLHQAKIILLLNLCRAVTLPLQMQSTKVFSAKSSRAGKKKMINILSKLQFLQTARQILFYQTVKSKR